jgi:dynein heavy chain
VESQVDEMWRSAYKYLKTYSDKPMLKKLAEAMKNEVGNFKPHVPLVMIMCNKGLRDRHWDQIGEVVGFSVRPAEKTGLVDIIERNLTPYLPKMEEISESASKEWSLEKNLDKQLSQWQDAVFLLQPYRDSGTSILSGSCVDEIQSILDDQVVSNISIGTPSTFVLRHLFMYFITDGFGISSEMN